LIGEEDNSTVGEFRDESLVLLHHDHQISLLRVFLLDCCTLATGLLVPVSSLDDRDDVIGTRSVARLPLQHTVLVPGSLRGTGNRLQGDLHLSC
ncbi:hypothetical protein PMAYCL1PPCAC_11743, partial [Pristionchus mayeri]